MATPMTSESFSSAIVNAFTKPPVDDGHPDGWYAHAYLGRHAKGRGRRYRRGKNRCKHCGLKMSAKNGPVDEDRHLSPKERIIKNMNQPSPLLAWLKHRAG